MEVSALLVIAQLHGIRAGAIVNIDNYVFEREIYEPHKIKVFEGIDNMLQVVLDAATSLA